jgi:integrase
MNSGSTMAIIRLKHVVADIDRHGNVRYYYRIKGKTKIRLRGSPGSEEFLVAYSAAERGERSSKNQGSQRTIFQSDSFNALVEKYYHSAQYKALASETQLVRRRVLKNFCEKHGDKPYKTMLPRHIRMLRDAIAHTPEAATTFIKTLRGVFKYAMANDLVTMNPAKEIEYLHKKGSEGFHTWSDEEVAQFEGFWPIGTKPRLAMALLLYTGQRRSDVIRLGRQHEKYSELHYRQQKTALEMVTPIIPELRKIIDASPCGQLTYLVTEFGRPYTAKGFGVRFRNWCDQAGLKHCSAHGLRKAAATSAAEKGATEAQLKAIFGWKTSHEVDRYIKKARQHLLANYAQHLVVPDGTHSRKVSHPRSSFRSGGTNRRKNRGKSAKIAKGGDPGRIRTSDQQLRRLLL